MIQKANHESANGVASMAPYKWHGTSNEFDSSSLLPSESHCVMEFLS